MTEREPQVERAETEGRAGRQFMAIRFLVPLPIVICAIFYFTSPRFSSMANEGVRLLVAGDVQALRDDVGEPPIVEGTVQETEE